MTVWLVIVADLSETNIVGVFDNEAKAKEVAEMCDGMVINYVVNQYTIWQRGSDGRNHLETFGIDI